MAQASCVFPKEALTEDGCVLFSTFEKVLSETNCRVEAGTCFVFVQEIHDKHGHKLDGDWDPEGRDGCNHRETPEWRAEHKREKKMSKEAKHEEPKHEEALAVPAPAAIQEQATEKLKAVTEQPAAMASSAAGELSGIIGHDVSGMQVVMAIVAVAGGGAAWKFYQQRQKLKHEETMERMKHERKQQDDSHKQCDVARTALEARVAAAEQKNAALEAKLAEVEKKASKGGLDFDGFDPDDVQEEIEKLKKAVKKLTRKAQDAAEDEDDD